MGHVIAVPAGSVAHASSAQTAREARMSPSWSRPELGDHVLAEQLDRVHHGGVGDLVRIEQAEQQVAIGRVVAASDLEAALGPTDDARAGRLQVVEGEE